MPARVKYLPYEWMNWDQFCIVNAYNKFIAIIEIKTIALQ